MSYAIRFVRVSKRYPRGGQRYRTLRDDASSILRLAKHRATGGRSDPGGPVALEHVSFDVQEGDSFAIIGPNGAGKTTILKLIARISHPTEGRVRVRGRASALIDVASGVHPELTGRENILLYGQILGMTKADVRRRFDDIVNFSELSGALDAPVKTYSTGMQLRLGFSIASHLDPDIFVVDEALAVGDAGFQARCVERMTTLVSEGHTLVLVSHYIAAVEATCKKAMFLREGRIEANGSVGEVIDAYLGWVDSSRDASFSESIEKKQSRYVVLEELSFHDRSGEERASFETGDDVTIRIRLRSLVPITSPHVSIGITDHRRGNLIFCSMLVDGGAPDRIAGTAIITCRLSALPLQPRVYQIWLAVDSEHAHEFFDWQPVASFRIAQPLVHPSGPASRSNLAFEGPVYVPHEWGIESLD